MAELLPITRRIAEGEAMALMHLRRTVPAEAGLGLLAAVNAVLACVAAARVETPIDSDLGLVAALPPAYWLGVLTVNVLFVVALRRDRPNPWLLALLVACLVVMLYGAAAFASSIPRSEVAWRHNGIADSLLRNGQLDPGLDAYFNWPGFFALLTFLTDATGLPPAQLALWAPIVNGLLWLAALALVARQLTADPRRLWLTLWLFCLGNWIDQDYLSPQAFGFFLYLVVLALLLGRLGAKPRFSLLSSGLSKWWRGRSPTEPLERRRVAALLVALLLTGVMTGSHQLTPFMLLVASTALVATGRCWAARFPLLAAVMLVIWLVYPASTYLAGHPPLHSLGVGVAASRNLGDRLAGSEGHLQVVQLRMTLTVAIWVLAAVGVVLARRNGSLDLRPFALAAAPFALLPFQTYGGEMLMRATLFALPFMAFFAAGALLSVRPVQSRGRQAVLAIVCLTFTATTITARYGNARFDMFTPAEIEASKRMYELTPADAMLISGAHPTPWRYRDYESYRSRTIEDICGPVREPVACSRLVHGAANRSGTGAVLLLSRSSAAAMVMEGYLSQPDIDRLEQEIRRRPGVFLMYENRDAHIYWINRSGARRGDR